jgi:hypothetical protein
MSSSDVKNCEAIGVSYSYGSWRFIGVPIRAPTALYTEPDKAR